MVDENITVMNRILIVLATLTGPILPSHASKNDDGDFAELPRDVKSLSDKGLGYFMFHGDWMCR